MRIHLIMPMGGGGTRFGKTGFNVPKPLIKIYDKPFFYWATQSIAKFADLESLTFVVLKEHINEFGIDKEILSYYPDAKLVVIPEILQGALLTCLKGAQDITDNKPILFNDCDHLFLCNDFYEFCKSSQSSDNCIGGLLSFSSDDPRFSYIGYDENGVFSNTREKEVVSSDAICGAYYFGNKSVFTRASEQYLKNCPYKEFFLSGVYNYLSNKESVKVFKVDTHVSFGTPDEYYAAQDDKTYLQLL